MLEENAEPENCQFPDDEEETLTQRMQKLNSIGLVTKSLATLQKLQSEAPIRNRATVPLTLPPKSARFDHDPLRRSTKKQRTSKLRKTTRTHSSKKEGYGLEDGRMFELSEVKGGRMPMIKEVQNMPVKEFSGRGILVFPNGKKF